MKTVVSEKVVARIWQQQMVTNLFTDTGSQIQVVFPGRVSNDAGCDFRDAVFAIDGRTITGDIEVHVRSSQWYGHGHHLDPNYNDIVLHVVLWHDNEAGTVLQNGEIIPLVCLSPFLIRPLSELQQETLEARHTMFPCLSAKSCIRKESLSRLLTVAGEKRFTAKVALFRNGLRGEKAGQLIFRNMARALGYTKNTEQFERLADKLALNTLEKIKRESSVVNQARILGIAGLLPSQRSGLRHWSDECPEVEELERTWRSICVTGTMTEADWCFYRVRPDNFPTRRIIALSHLLCRYRRSGLLYGMLELVRKASEDSGHRWIEHGLTITGHGYWMDHYDFGIPSSGSPALLGQGRAGEIAVNIVLPFMCAWAEVNAEPGLREKATDIYFRYPKLGDNHIIRYMKQQLSINPDCKLSACQQQGMIHIFKTHCRYRNCSRCPVNLSPD